MGKNWLQRERNLVPVSGFILECKLQKKAQNGDFGQKRVN